jgi:hypothetical protein
MFYNQKFGKSQIFIGQIFLFPLLLLGELLRAIVAVAVVVAVMGANISAPKSLKE